MDYPALKALHIGAVALSYALFFIRGVWMMRDSALLHHAFTRIVPHAVDTVLLVSAIMLAVTSRQYPLEAPWLTAKVIGLLLYIALGTVAIKRGSTRRVRVGAWVCAQLVFGYIVMVALNRSPLGPFH